ncbi:MAG: DUF3142 domain-containing protein [Planctomycetes bacterium]|nr:DUF3142 domain-containing protein [Planctomycetota bacterium]
MPSRPPLPLGPPSPTGPSVPRTPSRARRTALAIALALPVAAAACLPWLLAGRPPASPADHRLTPPVGFWYWTSRWEPSPASRRALETVHGVPLFVKAGTFTLAPAPAPTAAVPPTEASAPGILADATAFPDDSPPPALPVHLVYSFAPGLLSRFGGLAPAALAAAVARRYLADRAALVPRGWGVQGIQLDLDAPTRLLPRYVTLLAALRSVLPAGDSLSITSLVTWLGHVSFRDLAARADFHCPMPFGDRIPQRLEDAGSISAPGLVEQAIAGAEAVGRPYYLGLPTYGYAQVFDERARLLAVEGRLALDALSEERSVRWSESSPPDGPAPNGDVLSTFLVERPCRVGTIGLLAGWRVRFDTWTADGLARRFAAVAAAVGPACRGLLLFRLPAQRDPLVLDAEVALAAARGGPPAPRARLTLRRTGGSSVRIGLVNEGKIPSAASPASIEVRLSWRGAGLAAFGRGGFEQVETLAGEARSSRLLADTLRFRENLLAAGEHVESAEVELATASKATPTSADAPRARATGRLRWPDGRWEELPPASLELPEVRR